MIRRKNNPILNIITGLIITIIFSYSLFSQPFTDDEKKILELQDKRTLGKNKDLVTYLNSNVTENAYLSAIALANIGDTSVLNDLYQKLLTVDSYVPHNSAFALGESGTFTAADFLFPALKDNINKNDKLTRELVCELLNNLGRTGNETHLKELLSIKTNDGIITPYIALAIARFGMRKYKDENSFQFIINLMKQDDNEELNKMAAFCFNRAGDKQTLTPYKEILMKLSESFNPSTRMWSFSALGKLQDTSIAEKLLYELDIEADWRVRVNICNALGNLNLTVDSPLLEKVTTSLLQHGFEDASTHVSLAALQSLAKLNSLTDTRNPLARKIQQELLFYLGPNKAIDWQIKAEAIRTYAKIFKDEAKNDLLAKFSETDNYDIKAAVIGAFAFMENSMVYKELRDSISADVMRYNEKHPNKDGSMIGSNDLAKVYKAFVDALSALDDKLDAENRNIIRLIFSEFSASRHAAITDVCLSNLQDSMYLQYRGETCQIMMFDYESFKYPKDKDVIIMFIQSWDAMKYDGAKELLTKNLKHEDYDIAKASADALKNITGNYYENQITAPKYRHDFDWNFIDKLGEKKIALIKTNQGIIKLELYPETAPFTVQNFVKLSEKGYYNNTIFHRVIPNFVIQGGDPTGTGYGSPGYSIRSEFSPLSFEEYTVGMASSGKDTEGSQFFITHSPQPHLDGKYTLFGKVTEGFDVVDKIQIGDFIESISFSAQ